MSQAHRPPAPVTDLRDRSWRPRRLAALVSAGCALTLAACALTLGGCGDTLQDRPIPHNALEGLILTPYPVYWLGGAFAGLKVTDAVRDPSGASYVQYGDCVEGGQSVCVAPLRVVTSPDNSFLPAAAHSVRTRVRGVEAIVAQAGRTIEIPTGGVVVEIYARNPGLAAAAARTIVPIDVPAMPGSPLPAALPNTGFGARPLPSQVPPPYRPPH
jgi:hypothetical protein